MRMSMIRNVYFVGCLLCFIFFSSIGCANPIPVYPHPEPTLIATGVSESFSGIWLGLIYIINFCVDVLILYAGLSVLDRFQVLPKDYVFSLSKKMFFLAVGLISLIGLGSEFLLGAWVGGLVVAAVVILFSFIFIGRWLLELTWANSGRIGFFALTINILVWIVFYSII